MKVSWDWYTRNAKVNPNGQYAPIIDLCLIHTQLEGEVLYSLINMWANTAVSAIMITRSHLGIEIMLHLHATWMMN